MARFKALYYPSWDPPVRWLRSMLLFFDRIEVIRPKDVDPEYTPANQAVFDADPDCFGEICERQYQVPPYALNLDVLDKAMGLIAERSRSRCGSLAPYVDDDGNISIDHHVFLHNSKMFKNVGPLLAKHQLLNAGLDNVTRDLGMPDFKLVDADASYLILSVIARHYATARGLRTLTDRPLDYIAANMNPAPPRRPSEATAGLATSIISIEIPAEIEQLTPRQFVALRDRYAAIREPFHGAMQALCNDHRLGELGSRKQYRELVSDVTRDFYEEMKAVRRSQALEPIKRWTPIGIGLLSSACSLGTGVAVPIGVGISAALHVYQGLRAPALTTDRIQAQQLLGHLRREILHPTLLRRITLP